MKREVVVKFTEEFTKEMERDGMFSKEESAQFMKDRLKYYFPMEIEVVSVEDKEDEELKTVLYRYCDGFSHLVIYKDSVLYSDEFEGFPDISIEELIMCLEKSYILTDNVEKIIRNMKDAPILDILKELEKLHIINLEMEKIED